MVSFRLRVVIRIRVRRKTTTTPTTITLTNRSELKGSEEVSSSSCMRLLFKTQMSDFFFFLHYFISTLLSVSVVDEATAKREGKKERK